MKKMWQAVVINLLPSAMALAEKYILKKEKMKPDQLQEMFADQFELNKKIAQDIDILSKQITRLKRQNRIYTIGLASLAVLVLLQVMNFI